MKIAPFFSILLLSTGFAHATWAQVKAAQPDFVRKYESLGVPAQPRAVEFDPTKNFPLPANTSKGNVAFTVKAQPPSEKEVQAFAAAVKAATQSKELASRLGADSRLLSGGELPKAKSENDGDPGLYKFTYYDYKKDQAVEAYVSGGKVTQIRERELGFQPTVSNQELLEAAQIISKHSTAKVAVESVRGIAQSGPDGRRQIHVFTADLPNAPKSAVVDLYSKKIVELKQ